MSPRVPPRWLFRILIVIAFVPFFTWTLLRRIWIEVRSIPVYIMGDWSEDWADLAHVWRTGALPPDGGDW
jgi:hypothetical protein